MSSDNLTIKIIELNVKRMTLCVPQHSILGPYLPLQLDSYLLDTIGICLRLTNGVIYWISLLL